MKTKMLVAVTLLVGILAGALAYAYHTFESKPVTTSAATGRVFCTLQLTGRATDYLRVLLLPGQSCSKWLVAAQHYIVGATVSTVTAAPSDWIPACTGTIWNNTVTVITQYGTDDETACSLLH